MEEGEGDEMRLLMFQTLLEIITKVLRSFDSLAYEPRDFKDNLLSYSDTLPDILLPAGFGRPYSNH